MQGNRKIMLLAALLLLVFAAHYIYQNNVYALSHSLAGLADSIERHAVQGSWNKARRTLESVESLWAKGRLFTGLNYAETYDYFFTEALNRINRAVNLKNMPINVTEVRLVKVILGNFIRFIPRL